MAASLKAVPQAMKAALRLIYPPQCLACGASVGEDGALCPGCWRDCEFITGCVCQHCGVPLPGAGDIGALPDEVLICDDCQMVARPWQQARAALVYRDVGRALVLALKHRDRPDLALPLGRWMAGAAVPLVRPGMVVVPVPLHPFRLLSRKFNQAALLSAQLAKAHGLVHLPAALTRLRATPAQDHRGHGERHQNLQDALAVTPRMRARLVGAPVLLVDDVMASGATLGEAARALGDAGAGPVFAVVLARAVKD
ncbi:MAG: ComF family protein [Paracoccus sp. (in: a-proteobacteria)]|nr:ComF family protein [Paracoccus sp. (in: a-proteobacteria)]